ESVGERAGSVMEIENGEAGRRGTGRGIERSGTRVWSIAGGHPPRRKMQLAGIEVTEAHRLECEADVFRSPVQSVRRVQYQLPKALIEEQARGEIGAYHRQPEAERQRLQQP